MNLEIAQALQARGITEVVHFTTNRGLVGVLRMGALLPRRSLRAEATLEHILQLNSIDRSRDLAWHGHVNLSLHRINAYFFQISRRWHELKDNYWCILSFDISIASAPKVVFTTTNNAYDPHVLRGEGVAGLQALFNSPITRKPGWIASRAFNELPAHTTCPQAELLYPGPVPLEALRRIYVPDDDVYDEVYSKVLVLAPQLLEWAQIEVAPDKFR